MLKYAATNVVRIKQVPRAVPTPVAENTTQANDNLPREKVKLFYTGSATRQLKVSCRNL